MSARDSSTAPTDKNGIPIYGMDAELEAKKAARKNPQMEADVQYWVESLIGRQFPTSDFEVALKDGLILCDLVNAVKPGTIKKVNNSKLAFKQMENIEQFLTAIRNMGVRNTDLFQTVDLYEGKNIPKVVECLYMFASVAQTVPGYRGPAIGTKLAEKNERQFSEDTLRESSMAMSKLSLGSHGCANQSGMRLGAREVIKSNEVSTSSEVSFLSKGSHGMANQSGMRQGARDVIKTNDAGSNSEVTFLSKGSSGLASQAGSRDGAREIIKVQQQPTSNNTSTSSPSGNSNLDDLERLASLRDKGILTQEEFEAKKRQILGL